MTRVHGILTSAMNGGNQLETMIVKLGQQIGKYERLEHAQDNCTDDQMVVPNKGVGGGFNVYAVKSIERHTKELEFPIAGSDAMHTVVIFDELKDAELEVVY